MFPFQVQLPASPLRQPAKSSGGWLVPPINFGQLGQSNVAMAKVAIKKNIGKSSRVLFQSSRLMFHGFHGDV